MKSQNNNHKISEKLKKKIFLHSQKYYKTVPQLTNKQK